MGIYNAAESEAKRTGGDLGDILTRMHNEQFEGNKEVVKEVAIYYIGGKAFQLVFRGGKYVLVAYRSRKAAQALKNLVKISEKVDDVIIFSSKFGDEVVEGISNFKVVGDKLILNQLHLQGSTAGKVGRKKLWDMAKSLGKQFNVKEVLIQGGRRTTGKYKGTVPSPITIKVP